MQLIFDIISWLARPVVRIFVALVSPIAFLLGALAAPQSWMNAVVCVVIDVVTAFLPSTPDNLKVGALIDSVASTMPIVGRGIVVDIFQTLSAIFAITIVIKIYKLIPFKAS